MPQSAHQAAMGKARAESAALGSGRIRMHDELGAAQGLNAGQFL